MNARATAVSKEREVREIALISTSVLMRSTLMVAMPTRSAPTRQGPTCACARLGSKVMVMRVLVSLVAPISTSVRRKQATAAPILTATTPKVLTLALAMKDTAALATSENAPTSTKAWTRPTPTDATRSPLATTPSAETPACVPTVSPATATLTAPAALTSTNAQTLKRILARGTRNVQTPTDLTPAPVRQNTKETEPFASSHFPVAT